MTIFLVRLGLAMFGLAAIWAWYTLAWAIFG